MIRTLDIINEKTDVSEPYLILVDKPIDWTSFDVVKKIRGALSRKLGIKKVKVGHAGTLDPLATGLVLVGIHKGTKWLHELQGLDKVYSGQFKIGATTATYDAEMEEENQNDISHLSPDKVVETSSQFMGKIDQIPPLYSAVKVKGQRAYKAARRGKTVELEARQIRIETFAVTHEEGPYYRFEVHCSKGTYIRSLVHDLGQVLGVGAYLTALRRTKVGDYDLEKGWQLSDLIKAIEGDQGPGLLDGSSIS